MPNRLTFIGKAEVDDAERDALILFGRGLWRMGTEVTLVPRGSANIAVIDGVTSEGGQCRLIGNAALQAPRDGLVVYADNALIEAIKRNSPSLDLDADAVVINDINELQQYVEALLAAIWKVENAGPATQRE